MQKIISILIFLFWYIFTSYGQIDSSNKLNFDLGITRGGNVKLWPIIKITKNKDVKDIQLLFTIFQTKKNFKVTSKHNHFLPLYWSDSNTNGKNFKLLTTYYPSLLAYQKDYRKHSKSFKFLEFAPEISLLEFTKTKNGNYLKNNIFFFLWYKNDKVKNQTYFITFPLYWYYNNKDKRTHTLFPLYSYGNYNLHKNKYSVITPLFWHIKYPENGYKTFLFPIFFNQKHIQAKDTYDRTVLFPIIWHYRDKNYDNNVFFPLVWRYKNNIYNSFTLFPIFSVGKSIGGVSKHRVITPFYWQISKNSVQTDVLFPFWIRRKVTLKGNDYTSNYIFPFYRSKVDNLHQTTSRSFIPFYRHYKSSVQNNLYLFPFIFKKENNDLKYLAIFPFYTKVSKKINNFKKFTITPFFQHVEKSGRYNVYKRNVLFPIFWSKKDRIYIDNYLNGSKRVDTFLSSYTVFFPLWWHYIYESNNTNSSVLFPLIFNLKSNNYRSFSFMPLFSKGYSLKDSTSKHYAITPFYWHFEKKTKIQNYIYPIWWNKQTKYKKANVIFPLWWSYENKIFETKSKVFFPFVWNIKTRNKKAFFVMPFYGKGTSLKDSTNKFYAITPLFWHLESKYKTRNFLFPILWHKHNQNKNYTTIFPLWWSKQKYNKTHKVLFPLWWSFNDTSDQKFSKVLFPFVWNFKNSFYKSLTFFPLYSKGISSDLRYNHLAITPLFWHLKEKTKFTTILFPIYWKTKDSANKENKIVLFPFYWNYKTRFDTTKVYFPFGFYTKSKYNATHLIFPLYFKNKYLHNDASLKAITPLYWHYKSKNKTNSVLFPIVYSFKNKYFMSFTFFPLFSKGKSANHKQKYTAFTPLFWNTYYNGIHRVNLIPIFSYKKDTLNNKSFSLLYFLFRYKKQDTERKVSLLWPFCIYKKDSVEKQFHFVPFVWFKKSDSLNYNAFLPLYYYAHSIQGSQFNLLWQIYTRTKANGYYRTNSLFFKSIYSKKYINNDYAYRLMYFMYVKTKYKGTKELTIFPFYQNYSDSVHRYNSKSYFFGMYNKFKKGIPNTNKYYIEEKVLWFIRLRSNYKSLKQQGVTVERKKLKG